MNSTNARRKTIEAVILGMLFMMAYTVAAHAQIAHIAAVVTQEGTAVLDDNADILAWVKTAMSGVTDAVVAGILAWTGLHVRSAVLRYALNAALPRAAAVAVQYSASEVGAVVSGASAGKYGLAKGAQYITSHFAATMKALDITPDRVSEMVAAEVAKLPVSGVALKLASVADTLVDDASVKLAAYVPGAMQGAAAAALGALVQGNGPAAPVPVPASPVATPDMRRPDAIHAAGVAAALAAFNVGAQAMATAAGVPPAVAAAVDPVAMLKAAGLSMSPTA